MGTYFSTELFIFIGVLQINENKFIKLITIFCLSFGNSFAENILIEAKKISLDKKIKQQYLRKM